MANAGTTGGDWERLETEISATRSDLAEVAGAVNGLTELVTDLVRRSSIDHQGDRWQARLGSLETRLEMIETSLRTEVERMRATAGAVDAIADDFRSTVGGTRNLVDLAETITDRIGGLQSLERQVRGAAQDVAAAVEGRLGQEADERERSTSALSGRVERVETALNQQTDRVEGALAAYARGIEDAVVERVTGALDRLDALAAVARDQEDARGRLEAIDRAVADARQALVEVGARVEAVSGATNELPAIEERLAARLRDATSWGDSLGQLSAQVADLQSRLDAAGDANRQAIESTVTELTNEVRGLGAQVRVLGESAEDDTRLREIAGALAQVRAQQPHIALRLDQLSTELAAVRTELAQPDAGHASLVERLDGLAAGLRTVVASVPDPRGQLDQLSAKIAELAGADTQFAERVAYLLDQQATTLIELRSALPQTADRLDRLASDVAALHAIEVPTVELGPLLERVDRFAVQLDQELTAVREHRPEVTFDVEPLLARLDALTDHVRQLQTAQPNFDAVLSRVATVLNDQSSALAQLQSGQPQLAVRLDQLAADLAELRERPTGADLPERVDRLGAEVAAIRASELLSGAPMAPLAERLDVVLQTLDQRLVPAPDVRPALDQLASSLDGLRQDLIQLDRTSWESQVGGQIGDLTTAVRDLDRSRPDVEGRLDQLTTAVHELRALHVDPSAPLEQLAATTAALVERHPELSIRLDQVQAELADLRARLFDPEAAVAPIAERLGAVASEVNELSALAPAIERLSAELTELRGAQLDPTALVDAIGDRFDRIAAEIAALRSEQREPAALVAALGERLDRVHAEVVALGLAEAPTFDLTSVHQQLDHLTEVINGLRSDQPDVIGAIAALRSDQPDPNIVIAAVGERLDRVHEEIAALRLVEPPEIDLGAVHETLARINAEISALRTDQPDVLGAIAALHDSQPDPQVVVDAVSPRLDELAQRMDALAALANEPQAPLDVSLLLGPLENQLHTVDSRAAAMTEAVGAVEAALTRSTTQLDDIAAQLTTLRDAPDETAFALAPVVDRLAIVVDTVTGLHNDVASLADSFGTLRTERQQLVQMAMETNGRLDLLSANLGEMRQASPDLASRIDETNDRINSIGEKLNELQANRPDFTASFLSLSDLLEDLQNGVSTLHNRVDTVGELVRQSGPVQPDFDGLVAPLQARLDAIAAAIDHLSSAGDAPDSLLVAISDRVDAIAGRIDALPGEQPDITPSVASALGPVNERLDALAARVGDLRAEQPDLATTLAPVAAQLDVLVQALRDADARHMAGLADLHRQIEAATTEPPDGEVADARLDSLSEDVSALTGDVRSAIRAVVGLGADITGLRNDLEELAAANDQRGTATTQSTTEVTSALSRLDAVIAERDQELRRIVERVDDAVAREPDDTAVRSLADSVHELQGDVRSTRSELAAIRAAIDNTQAEVRRASESQLASGAAALVASAAAAMARLEVRIDGEFDDVSKQMESVGTLLAQAIEAVHRVEAQVVGAQPASERMRDAAASVLETLRENVRQRASRPSAGPPPELGSGR